MVVIKFVLGNPCPAVQLKPRDGVAIKLHFFLNYSLLIHAIVLSQFYSEPPVCIISSTSERQNANFYRILPLVIK